jgi:hypothetical protein
MCSDFIASKATRKLPLVYGPEITACHYKGLLQEIFKICYGFP